ncbi:MAG: hypothetical protein M4579_000606 [Chaenotheca gracillima]|nr:MAG: hypothetical protein M4579_000606 [Chaenotheca gracillima]
MKFLSYPWAVVAGTLALAAASQADLPNPQRPILPPALEKRYLLPMFDRNPSARAYEIERNRAGFKYGPSLLGNLSYFPTGPLGDPMVKREVASLYQDADQVLHDLPEDYRKAFEDITEAGGLLNISSYELLYNSQWLKTLPSGPLPGSMSNYSQDLFFSMERLTINPFSIKRLHPTENRYPFEVEEAVVQQLTGMSLSGLHRTGRLFLADHSYQAGLPIIPGRFTAACSAYFFIHPKTGDFLPLAIKTNVGQNLTYTPLDEANDWMLAKIMFNSNDFFHGQIYHIANSHAVAEIVHEAALRTLSEVHPVRAFLDRVMFQAYAVRPIGEKVLFNPGGFFDKAFALSNVAVRKFGAEVYPSSAGLFQANYLERFVVRQGFRNCTWGPELSHVPFAEDALAIVESIRRFASSFVHTYYPFERMLLDDHELQAWVKEATEEAGVLDFPESPLIRQETLIDILTHMAYLTGVNHNILNGGTICKAAGVLPFHPATMHHAIPTHKGVESLTPFLPGLKESLDQISLVIRFNRPYINETRNTVVHMFSGRSFLSGASEPILRAAMSFEADMLHVSDRIQARVFNGEGLSQGMPFLYQALDPRWIPYYLSV